MANEIIKSNPIKSNPIKSSQSSAKPKRGLFGLARLSYDAWRTEVECAAELRVLSCEQQLTEQRQALAMTQLRGKLALAQADMDGRVLLLRTALEAEEMEGELTFQRQLRQAPPARRLQIVGAEMETQRLLLERDQLRRQRLTGTVPTPSPSLPIPAANIPTSQALLETHISDREIETLALRAVTRFASLEPFEAQREWARWRQELEARFPAYAAQEIAARADELRGLAE